VDNKKLFAFGGFKCISRFDDAHEWSLQCSRSSRCYTVCVFHSLMVRVGFYDPRQDAQHLSFAHFQVSVLNLFWAFPVAQHFIMHRFSVQYNGYSDADNIIWP
jgi:hypothetical protein